VRIETRARNAVSLLPDAGGAALHRHAIVFGGPGTIALPAPAQHLLATVRALHAPAALSRDAGRYLCNYLCWRASEATRRHGGPRIAAFVHVPPVRRKIGPRGNKLRLSAEDLASVGASLIKVIAAAAR